jgi:hypothetical protein
MRNARALAVCALLGAALVLGGCRGERAGENEQPQSPASLDTAGAVSGVPRERIEEYARPMSPEEAEKEGIVDTSIFLEDASPPTPAGVPSDSAHPAPPHRDTVRRDTTRRDTVRPPAP